MRHFTRRGLLGAALTVICGVALAQSGASGPGRGPGMSGQGGGAGMMGGRGGGMMMADPAGYLDGLKGQIAITAGQEAAWVAYADSVTASSARMDDMQRTMWQAMGTATWEERRDMMNRAFAARQQAFAAVHDAATKLETTLTPDQRSRAVAILPGLRTPGPMGHGAMHRSPTP